MVSRGLTRPLACGSAQPHPPVCVVCHGLKPRYTANTARVLSIAAAFFKRLGLCCGKCFWVGSAHQAMAAIKMLRREKDPALAQGNG